MKRVETWTLGEESELLLFDFSSYRQFFVVEFLLVILDMLEVSTWVLVWSFCPLFRSTFGLLPLLSVYFWPFGSSCWSW